jgi:hypothetical protein
MVASPSNQNIEGISEIKRSHIANMAYLFSDEQTLLSQVP